MKETKSVTRKNVREGEWENYQSDSVLYLDRGVGYTSVNICQN